MMRVLAIDPGPKKSAWLIWDTRDNTINGKGCDDNDRMLRLVRAPVLEAGAAASNLDHLAVEMVQSFGMAVGAEVFETVYWIGRFCQAWSPKPFARVNRMECKMHLCHHPRARDSNIRQALIDNLGPPGTKKHPGGTYGISGDIWSALAVAVTFAEASCRPSASPADSASVAGVAGSSAGIQQAARSETPLDLLAMPAGSHDRAPRDPAAVDVERAAAAAVSGGRRRRKAAVV